MLTFCLKIILRSQLLHSACTPDPGSQVTPTTRAVASKTGINAGTDAVLTGLILVDFQCLDGSRFDSVLLKHAHINQKISVLQKGWFVLTVKEVRLPCWSMQANGNLMEFGGL